MTKNIWSVHGMKASHRQKSVTASRQAFKQRKTLRNQLQIFRMSEF